MKLVETKRLWNSEMGICMMDEDEEGGCAGDGLVETFNSYDLVMIYTKTGEVYCFKEE